MPAEKFEIAVARYKENVDWIDELPYPVCVYDKSGDPPPTRLAPGRTWTPLPNIGREAGAIAHHIVTRWHCLADMTLFLQGSPFSHPGSVLRPLDLYNKPEKGFVARYNYHWDFSKDEHLFDPPGELRIMANDRMEFYRQLNIRVPRQSPICHGAQFSVTRELIQRRGLAFWQKLAVASLQIAYPVPRQNDPGVTVFNNYEIACMLEKAWPHIFHPPD